MRRSAEKGNRIWRKNGKALRDCRLSCFFFYFRESAIYNLLRYAFFTVQHNVVDQFCNDFTIVYWIC